MRIDISGKTVLRIPTGLILNRINAGIIKEYLKKEGIEIRNKDVAKFLHAVRKYRKSVGEWNFIEVSSSNGKNVTIIV